MIIEISRKSNLEKKVNINYEKLIFQKKRKSKKTIMIP